MKLGDWMRQKDMTDEGLSNLLGISRPAVTLYRNGKRIPKREIMASLTKVTKGKVTANDFY